MIYPIHCDTLISAAQYHGLNSEPDHEAGDLQDYIRASWALMTQNQRVQALKHPRLETALETAIMDSFVVVEGHMEAGGADLFFKVFEQHAEDEGADAEIGDLQEALRSCWDVMTGAQRSQLMRTESVVTTFESAMHKPAANRAPNVR